MIPNQSPGPSCTSQPYTSLIIVQPARAERGVRVAPGITGRVLARTHHGILAGRQAQAGGEMTAGVLGQRQVHAQLGAEFERQGQVLLAERADVFQDRPQRVVGGPSARSCGAA